MQDVDRETNGHGDAGNGREKHEGERDESAHFCCDTFLFRVRAKKEKERKQRDRASLRLFCDVLIPLYRSGQVIALSAARRGLFAAPRSGM